ncbi:MAG TPA: peptidoglycan DD-metalloendopeptidase family protein [Salinimicrobium sp.]|nr:peptidoglycan DD-metalloendopeptidase family protein [Salinimicrobium sp.]
MKSFFNFKNLAVFLFLISGIQSFAQNREALEQRRLELREEIKKINDLRSTNKAQEQSIITQVEELNRKISATQKLIRVTNQQTNLLTREINENTRQIKKLEDELKILKEDYAEMIRKSYRSKSQQSRIMFLFSSENFLQAYKRLQYLKQYAKHRKSQGEEIKANTIKLEEMNKSLSEQKKSKENLIAENRETQKRLEGDKLKQQALMEIIRKKEGQFATQIKNKQQEIIRIDKEIDRLIKEAIAKTNKESGSTSRDVFELTPEAKVLAANFANNKGKLPWPVRTGIVAMGFGENRSSVVSSITVNSNGVRIETEKGATARAVFDGVVSEVQVIPGANKAVMIRHGDYLTIYNNLSTISVKRGDKVVRGEELGEIAKSSSTGKTVLYFLIYKNMQKLNPEDWIYKM